MDKDFYFGKLKPEYSAMSLITSSDFPSPPVTEPGWKVSEIDWPVCKDGNPSLTYAKLGRLVQKVFAALLPKTDTDTNWTGDAFYLPAAKQPDLAAYANLRDRAIDTVSYLWQSGRIASVVSETEPHHDWLERHPMAVIPLPSLEDHLTATDSIFGQQIKLVYSLSSAEWLVILQDHRYCRLIAKNGAIEFDFSPLPIEMEYMYLLPEIDAPAPISKTLAGFTVDETFGDFDGERTVLKLIDKNQPVIIPIQPIMVSETEWALWPPELDTYAFKGVAGFRQVLDETHLVDGSWEASGEIVPPRRWGGLPEMMLKYIDAADKEVFYPFGSAPDKTGEIINKDAFKTSITYHTDRDGQIQLDYVSLDSSSSSTDWQKIKKRLQKMREIKDHLGDVKRKQDDND